MKRLRHLPTVIFLGFISVMLILFIVLPKSDYSSSEKRYLKEKPTFSLSSLFSGTFGEDFETYLSDHFAGRNLWVGINAYYHLAIGNNGASGIYHGSDGYLINDPTEDDRLQKNIGVIDGFSESCGVDTAVVIAPSTGYICENRLPAVHGAYRDDRYFSSIEDSLNGETFVDVRALFKAAYANGQQLYYKTDHHWTSRGAYTAYCALADTLGYTARAEDDYTVSSYDGFYGTTYSSSGFWLTAPDTIEVWDGGDDVTVTITEGPVSTDYDSMFFPAHLDEDDKYPVFLDGNHAFTRICNEHADSDERLLVIKDSFAHSLVPFLSAHYSEIVMVDMRYYKLSVSELIDSEDIDRVLFVYSIDNLATDTDLVWLG